MGPALRRPNGRVSRASERRGARSGLGSRFRSGACLLMLVVCGVLVTSASRAQALSERGHVAVGFIGEEGSGAGELRAPSAVAVNDTTGDVYVVDAGNERIDRFGPDGHFLEAWGWGVASGGKEYERCAVECRAGLSGNGKFEMESPAAIAVDNSRSPGDPSAGDVYVEAKTSEEHPAIDKFSAAGAPLEIKHGAQNEHFEELHGLTVDPNGALWVYNAEELHVYDDGEPNVLCPEPGHGHGVPTCPGFGLAEPELEGEPRDGLAVAGGDVYLAQSGLAGGSQPRTAVGKFALTKEGMSGEPSLLALVDEVDEQETAGVATDAATGDVYLDNVTSIAAFDREGAFVQRFGEAGATKLQEGDGVAVASSSSSTIDPGYVYVADRGASRVDVYAPEPPGAPQVDGLSVQDVTAEAAQLDAQLDPHGESTRYYFEYGAVPCGGHPGSCAKLPLPSGGEAGAGCPREEDAGCFGDESVGAAASALVGGTTYHYRLVASNTIGNVDSEERTFATPPGGRFEADDRSWEMVSPRDMNGGEAEPLSEVGGLIQASEDGHDLAWVSTAPLNGAEGNRSLEATQLLSTRGDRGWSTQDIVTANDQGSGIELGTEEYRMFSPTLALGLLEPFAGGSQLAEPPLTPPAGEEAAGQQEKTPYLRADAPLAPGASEQSAYEAARANGIAMGNPGFLALLTAGEVIPGTQFGKRVKLLDATADLSHVVLGSELPLTTGSAAGRNLYEWSAGALSLISVLPDGEAAPAAQLGGGNTMVRDAISADGTRVFWNSENHLYMRDMLDRRTIELDGNGSEQGSARFQGASADGTTVFFTDESKLTSDSGAGVKRPDLYACEIAVSAQGCKLTDLTPSASEHADVLGLILGDSETGSSVYFMANGALSESASPGNCRPEPQTGAECNLYESVRTAGGQWDSPRLLARLASQDNPDWEPRRSPLSGADLGEVTARVSPNGRYLAFMSEQSLTGYDNRDANPVANGARDEEVFLFDAQNTTLICASCDPSGGRPRGVFDPPDSEPANEEGWGLVVDRPRIWQDRWLAGNLPGWTKSERFLATYQSRYLTDSGRLYFDSPADLVPEATNGKEDVYEYEPAGVPLGRNTCAISSATFAAGVNGCLGLVSSGTSPRESAFVDAGLVGGEGPDAERLLEGGGDVFFVSAGLSSAEAGASFAVYDAHECTGYAPCLTAEAPPPGGQCASTEACLGRAYALPASQFPATTQSEANGNVLPSQTTKPPKPTRAQMLAEALRTCRKLHRTKKRHRCEAAARARYAPEKRTKPGAAAKSASSALQRGWRK
jgi:hypothetical protein